MTQPEKEHVIKQLQDHVNKVAALQFEDYFLAESLYSRAMFFYNKYFKDSELYADDFLEINFRSVNVGTTAKAAWDECHECLLSFSQSMLDELQLPPGHIVKNGIIALGMGVNQQKYLYSGIFFTVASLVLWSFNTSTKWGLLAGHPNQMALNISLVFGIICISALFLTYNKKLRVVEWLGIGGSVVSMIVSSLV